MPNFSIDKTGGMGPSEIRVKPTDVNLGETPKMGYLKISGDGFSQTVKLTQKIGEYTYQYVFTTSQDTLSFGADGGTQPVTITSERVTLLGESEIKRENWPYSVQSKDDGLTIEGNQVTMASNETYDPVTKSFTYVQQDSGNTIKITCNQEAQARPISNQFSIIERGNIPSSGDKYLTNVTIWSSKDEKINPGINHNVCLERFWEFKFKQVQNGETIFESSNDVTLSKVEGGSLSYEIGEESTRGSYKVFPITFQPNTATNTKTGTIQVHWQIPDKGVDETFEVNIEQEAAPPVEYYIQIKEGDKVVYEVSPDRQDTGITLTPRSQSYTYTIRVWRSYQGEEEEGTVENYSYSEGLRDWLTPTTQGASSTYEFSVSTNEDFYNNRSGELGVSNNWGVLMNVPIVQNKGNAIYMVSYDYTYEDLGDTKGPIEDLRTGVSGVIDGRVESPIKSSYDIRFVIRSMVITLSLNGVKQPTLTLHSGFKINSDLLGVSGTCLNMDAEDNPGVYPETTYEVIEVNNDGEYPTITIRFNGFTSVFDEHDGWSAQFTWHGESLSTPIYQRLSLELEQPIQKDEDPIFEYMDTMSETVFYAALLDPIWAINKKS